jgi:hypothetical protein
VSVCVRACLPREVRGVVLGGGAGVAAIECG